jgi:hypothetical protein
MSGLYLPATLGPLAKLCGGEGRYTMAGVRVRDPGDGTFRCDVTDGRLALLARGGCPRRGGLGRKAATIPAAPWARIFAEKAKDHRGEPEPVSVRVAGSENDASAPFELATASLSLRGTLGDGHFPDVDAVLPQGPPVFAIRVNVELLAGLLGVVGKLLGAGTRKVTLAFWKPDVPMAVVAKDEATGVCLDGLLMPLT